MGENRLQRSNLKSRLDNIDAQTKLKGAAKVGDLWRLEKLGMWKKGLEVLNEYPELEGKPVRGGRGVLPVAFRKVAKVVGRSHPTISSWVSLVKHVRKTRSQFDRWAKIAVPKIVAKWSMSLPSKVD